MSPWLSLHRAVLGHSPSDDGATVDPLTSIEVTGSLVVIESGASLISVGVMFSSPFTIFECGALPRKNHAATHTLANYITTSACIRAIFPWFNLLSSKKNNSSRFGSCCLIWIIFEI
jgi:hypothetical protein